jgi:hypothetical protein
MRRLHFAFDKSLDASILAQEHQSTAHRQCGDAIEVAPGGARALPAGRGALRVAPAQGCGLPLAHCCALSVKVMTACGGGRGRGEDYQRQSFCSTPAGPSFRPDPQTGAAARSGRQGWRACAPRRRRSSLADAGAAARWRRSGRRRTHLKCRRAPFVAFCETLPGGTPLRRPFTIDGHGGQAQQEPAGPRKRSPASMAPLPSPWVRSAQQRVGRHWRAPIRPCGLVSALIGQLRHDTA